jgi:PhnB protein
MFQTNYTVNKDTNTIVVERSFEAPLDLVWQAWTDAAILDQWWAPKPFWVKTKTMDFSVGGAWVYSMNGPNGEQFWSKADYKKIQNGKSFTIDHYFIDAQGNRPADFPSSDWNVEFSAKNNITNVKVTMQFANLADLEKLVAMGFKEGFAMAHENLDQYIQAQFKLRQELKTDNRARVVTYLNFPGNTEEAMNFYRSVFKSEFSGKGLQRFGDIPQDAGHPPVADNVKKMILHVELPILGGHVLMATDAPKEMGFNLTPGNNMHICLEPETRAEAERLFNSLSAGGKVSMPLADMFFGSYFGELTDKYGINWMVNCNEPK